MNISQSLVVSDSTYTYWSAAGSYMLANPGAIVVIGVCPHQAGSITLNEWPNTDLRMENSGTPTRPEMCYFDE
jgi:hypothetical protein